MRFKVKGGELRKIRSGHVIGQPESTYASAKSASRHGARGGVRVRVKIRLRVRLFCVSPTKRMELVPKKLKKPPVTKMLEPVMTATPPPTKSVIPAPPPCNRAHEGIRQVGLGWG